jgi:hypothetical protein
MVKKLSPDGTTELMAGQTLGTGLKLARVKIRKTNFHKTQTTKQQLSTAITPVDTSFICLLVHHHYRIA